MQTKLNFSLKFIASLILALLAIPKKGLALDYNDISNLTCPSQQEFSKSTETLQIRNLPEGNICDSSKKSHLARVIKMANDLAVKLPQNWKGGAAEALQNPFYYINKMTSFIDMDLSQSDSIAYNMGGAIYLGSFFFNDDPLSNLIALVHESRHSDPAAPLHTYCYQGDIPFFGAGCDQLFSVDKNAGAYAYQVSFSYGLAKFSDKLSASDKKFLIDDALSTIGTRFNRIPSLLATPHDVLVVLDDKGKIFEVEPFTNEMVPRQTWVDNKDISRIEFNNKTNKILAWTEEGYVYSVGGNEKGIFFGKNIDGKKPLKVIDLQQMATGTTSFLYFINEDRQIKYTYFDPSANKVVSKFSGFQAKDFKPERVILSPNEDKREILDDEGILHSMGRTSFVLSDFQPPDGRKWQQVYGSYLFQDIFGLDKTGTFWIYDHYKKTVKSAFQTSGFGLPIKVFEGTTLRAFLLDNNSLELEYIGTQNKPPFKYTVPSVSKIVDAVFIRRYQASSTFAEFPVNPLFVNECKIKTALLNPWTGKAMGLSNTNSLIFEGHDEQHLCTEYSYIKNIDDISLESTEPKESANIGYSSTSLNLSVDMHTVKIKPYEPYEISK